MQSCKRLFGIAGEYGKEWNVTHAFMKKVIKVINGWKAKVSKVRVEVEDVVKYVDHPPLPILPSGGSCK